jgi:flagellin
MSISINTNVSSLQAQNSLSMVNKSLQQNQERLASGLRINSAADDAAGLSISDRMTAQIRGMNQAVRNANDGISMAQTAEGGLQEITNIMQRMRQLAVQSANESNTESDRASLDQEFQFLKGELDRIAESTTFNGKTLLDGALGETMFQVGADTGSDQSISVDMGQAMRSGDIGNFATEDYYLTNRLDAGGGNGTGGTITDAFKALQGADGTAGGGAAGGIDIGDGYFSINSVDINPGDISVELTNDLGGTATIGSSVASDTNDAETQGLGSGSAYVLAQAINNADAGVTATAKNASVTFESPELDFQGSASSYDLSINGQSILSGVAENMSASELASVINDYTDKTGVSASADSSGNLTLTGQDGRNINIAEKLDDDAGGSGGTFFNTGVIDEGTNASAVSYRGTVMIEADQNFELDTGTVGGNHFVSGETFNTLGEEAYEVTGGGFDASTNGGAHQTTVSQLGTTGITNRDDALKAINHIDSAIDDVDAFRAELGAVQNRFDSTIANLENASQNLTEARSRIQDADIAKEAAEMTQNNVRRQAASAVLAQANQQPQLALQLLQG